MEESPEKQIEELQKLLKGLKVNAKSNNQEQTIFQKLGGDESGEKIIYTAIDIHYDQCLLNEKLGVYFHTLANYVPEGMLKQKMAQQKFLTSIFGGPNYYEGRDIRTVHRHMKLNKDDYDEFLLVLKDSFKKVGADDRCCEQIEEVIGTFYKDLLNL